MAKRFFSSRSLNVFELELASWEFPRHAHNFFEIVFIKKGSGKHKLNDSTFDFNEGDIFLLTPNDEHEFQIKSKTSFGFIKFTEQLFLEKTEFLSDIKWRKEIDAVVLHNNSIPGAIVSNTADKQQLFMLFEMMKTDFKTPRHHSRSILLEMFGALLILISRNIKTTNAISQIQLESEQEKVQDILSYIRQNVLDKKAIKVSAIAKTFYMSPSYVSIFIKKHAGISIQQYVIQTKIKMAERLLKQTNLNISEIAQKTGFTDSSHFNKLFKKYKGMNPSAYYNTKIK